MGPNDVSAHMRKMDPKIVRQCLHRALASAVFARAPAISRFLEYVVERALDEDQPTISAYAVATEALGRSEDFDPQIDPVVRVTAGRLRQALDRYYASEGGSDPVRIQLPSGGYAPAFEPQSGDAPARPTPPEANAPHAEAGAGAGTGADGTQATAGESIGVPEPDADPARKDLASDGSAEIGPAEQGQPPEAGTKRSDGSADGGATASARPAPDQNLRHEAQFDPTREPPPDHGQARSAPVLSAVDAGRETATAGSGPAQDGAPSTARTHKTLARRRRSPLGQLLVPLTAAFGGALIFALALLFAEWAYDPPTPSMESKIQTSSVERDSPASHTGMTSHPFRPDFFPRLALDAERVEEPLDWYRADAAKAAARSVIGRFDEVLLVSEESRDEADYDLIVEAFGLPDSMRIFLRLEQRHSGVLVWSHDYELRQESGESSPSLTSFFGRALAPVLSPYGILLSDLSSMETPPPRVLCVLKAYAYFDKEALSERLAAHECLDAMIANGVVHPTIFALKAFLHLEGYRTSRTVIFDRDDPLREAQLAARRALEAAPGSARAHQANFAVYKIERRREQALQSAERARQANPYDLDVLADVAAYLGSQGLHAEAAPLFRQTNEIALQLPSWLIANYAFHLLLTGDQIGAYELALSRPSSSSAILAAAAAIAAQDRGDISARNEAIAALMDEEPTFLADPTDRFLRRGFAADVARVLGERLAAATAASGVDVERGRQ